MLRVTMAGIVGLLLEVSEGRALDMTVALEKTEHLLYVNLSGQIIPGDEQRFQNLVLPYIRSGNMLFKVNTFSTGGDVKAAMGIGAQIDTAKSLAVAPTLFNGYIDQGLRPGTTVECWHWVPAGDGAMNNAPGSIHTRDAYGRGDRSCDCESACFLMWIGGVAREGNFLGIHRSKYNEVFFGSLPPAQAEVAYNQVENSEKEYFKKLRVPDSIIELMFSVPSTAMHFLKQSELQLLQSNPYLEELTLARCGRSQTRTYRQGNERITHYDNNHINCYRSVLKEIMQSGAKEYLSKYGP